MNLQIIMLNEKSQAKKVYIEYLIQLYKILENAKYATESNGCLGMGKGGKEGF